MKKPFKSLIAVLVVGALTFAVMHFTTGIQQQRQSGRRGAGADGPVPVVASQVRLADVPVWLEGVGTAKALNTVTVRAQVDGRLSHRFQGRAGRQEGRRARQDRSRDLPGAVDQAVAKKALDEALLANTKRDLERYQRSARSPSHSSRSTRRDALMAQQEAQVKSDQAADRQRARHPRLHDHRCADRRANRHTPVDEGNIVHASDTGGIVTITQVQPISVIFTLPQQQLPDDQQGARRQGIARRSPGDGQQDGPRHRRAAGHRQPGRSDDRHDPAQGRFPQRRPAALARPVRQCPTAAQDAGGRRRRRRPQPCSAVRMAPTSTSSATPSKAAMRHVTVAQQDDADAVIPQGLSASEKVVTSGFARLKDGAERQGRRPADKTPGVSHVAGRTAGRRDRQSAGQRHQLYLARAGAGACGRPQAEHKRGAGKHRGQQTGRKRAPEARHERLPPLYRASDRDLSAWTCDGSRRCARLFRIAGLLAAAGRFSDHPGDDPTSRREPARRCRRWSPPRSSAQFGQIPSLASMTSTSSYGLSQITLQFNLDRDIDAAAQDVQSAINAAGSTLPRNLPYPPTYSKVNPADAADRHARADVGYASRCATLAISPTRLLAQRLSTVSGVGHVSIEGGIRPAVRIEADVSRLASYGFEHGGPQHRHRRAPTSPGPRARSTARKQSYTIAANDQIDHGESLSGHRRCLSQRRARAPQGRRKGRAKGSRNARSAAGTTASLPSSSTFSDSPAPTSSRRSTGIKAELPRSSAPCRRASSSRSCSDRTGTIRASDPRRAVHAVPERRAGRSWWCCLSLRSTRATIIAGVALPVSLIADVRRDVVLRLQPRQSLADGLDDRHRVRRRRCHRHDREHRPPSSKRAKSL